MLKNLTHQCHQTFKVSDICDDLIDESLQLRIESLECSLLSHSNQHITEKLVDDVGIEVGSNILRPKLDTGHVVTDIGNRVDCLPSFVEHHQPLINWWWKKAENVSKLSEQSSSCDAFACCIGQDCNKIQRSNRKELRPERVHDGHKKQRIVFSFFTLDEQFFKHDISGIRSEVLHNPVERWTVEREVDGQIDVLL